MSDMGWAAVSEYETHQLAEDSEDEKRIFKAEARARRKFKDTKKKFDRKPFQFPGSGSLQTAAQSTSSSGASKRSGVCYACGKPGHTGVLSVTP